MRFFFNIFRTILVLLFLSLPAMSFATTVGNPINVTGEKVGLSIEYEKISDGTLECTVQPCDDGDNAEMSNDALVVLKLIIGIHPKVDIDLSLGLGNQQIDGNGPEGVAFGFGIKSDVFNLDNGLRFIADFDITCFWTPPQSSRGTGDIGPNGYADYNVHTSPASGYNQWHVAVSTNKTIKSFFTPYIGTRYSSTVFWRDNYESANKVGLFGGVDMNLADNLLWLSLEGRIVDESAITLGAGIKF